MRSLAIALISTILGMLVVSFILITTFMINDHFYPNCYPAYASIAFWALILVKLGVCDQDK